MAMVMTTGMAMDAIRAKTPRPVRSPSRRPAKRSGRNWALRGGLAIVAAGLGYVSTTQTLAFVIGKTNIERAYALSPNDGRLAGRLAEKMATADNSADARAATALIARQALDAEPLAISALTALALTNLYEGNLAKARSIFVHSDALSRRELGPRVWLIEDAVTRKDVAGALRHYDIALRTSRNARDVLFPILVQAVADPAIAASLAATLRQRPAWGSDFLTFFGGLGPDPLVTAGFFRRLAGAGVAIPEVAQVTVVNALAKVGSYRESWAFYRTLRPGVDPRRLRDPDFTAELQTPSVFDWMPMMQDAGVTATISGGAFDFSAPAMVGGVVLQQVEQLPPGKYRLQGLSIGIEQPQQTAPYWRLSCIDGRELGRVLLPSSNTHGGRFAGTLAVPADCSVQTLQLVVRSSTAISGAGGQIEQVTLSPI